MAVFRLRPTNLKLVGHLNRMSSTLQSSPVLQSALRRVFEGPPKELFAEIRRGTRVICVSGLVSDSARALAIAALQRETGRPFAIVTQSNRDLETWERDLRFWYSALGGKAECDDEVLILPASESYPYAGASPHAETLEQRALTLWQLSRRPRDFVLLTARALARKTVAPAEIARAGARLQRDEDQSPEELVEKLLASGYVREDPVGAVGEFSIRGGILDVWSPGSATPVRFEFFGDTIDSIREFDPETQLSTQKVEAVGIAPMRETLVSSADFCEWAERANERWSEARSARALRDRTAFAAEGESFAGWEWLMPLVRAQQSSIFDYLKDVVLIFDEPATIENYLADAYQTLADRYGETDAADDIALSPEELYLTVDELRERIDAAQRVEMRTLGRAAAHTDQALALETEVPKVQLGRVKSKRLPMFLFPSVGQAPDVEWTARSVMRYHGRLSNLAADTLRAQASGATTIFVMPSFGVAERVAEILGEYDVSAGLALIEESSDAAQTASAIVTVGRLTGGFAMPSSGLVVHVEGDLSDEAKLYVPVERLDLVQRYSSAEGHQPPLDRLGGLGWQKTKAKAKRAMRDMADELLRLYAERKLVLGHAFPTDAPWQREFEEGFEYTLTPDQETAIEDVKHDMETPTPMDRLLCGDVGYGKTEVAMRAAFKAVMDGKQAAVLTPTTVLAYQHFDTFRQRFAPFPVKIELLSRFRSTKEQREVVKRVEAGEVDVVIGTHRMLSQDVGFRDLGLVVVDEEQRFGVAHKERLKQLKKRVDVLTLSATPIPRTLNMSLSGLRDMSLIETPPSDRLAIQTQVVQASDVVIKSAIELELARGGQVFFIHNRVESIETIAALVKRLVPQARIAVGHGKMNEKEMERVMLDFIGYKYDVLVATTIIENGIDIPRANTIIINRADNYGLSQLYQLRGRVGRSNRRAYAYLLIPAEQELSPIARRRLAAIREFSDLGAGFRIAALDLELRGAGNLLGGEQSGHMDALGFDLYTQMLERTVAELRGEQIEDEPTASFNLGVDVAIPESYIADMGQRLRTYKRVSSARDEEALAAIRAETEDRYGRIPEPVENLFDYARLRQTAETVGIVSIDRIREGIAIKLTEKARVAPEKLMELVRAREGASFTPSGVLRLELSDEEKDHVLKVARRVLLQVRADG